MNYQASTKTINKSINNDIKHLLNWLNVNNIVLNVSKTELDHEVIMKLNSRKLFYTDLVKYLGIYLDRYLTWNIKQIM